MRDFLGNDPLVGLNIPAKEKAMAARVRASLKKSNGRGTPLKIRQPSGGKHYAFTRKLPKDTLFDTITFNEAAAQYRVYPLFTVPVGQPDPVSGVIKTEQETNQIEAVKLPSGESFRGLAMSWLPITQNITFEHMLTLTYFSVIAFVIDNTTYFEIPFGYIGSGGGENITLPSAALALFPSIFQHANISAKNLYANKFKLLIPPNREFRFELRIGIQGPIIAPGQEEPKPQIRFYLHGIRQTPTVYTGD